MVGVNKYAEENEPPIKILRISKKAQLSQRKRLSDVLASRDQDKVRRSLERLKDAMKDESINLMPYMIDAVESYATIEEISNIGRRLYGGWKEPVIV
jgi:methylmalonyl-CoA mutase N-terminal domain/subunit